MNDKISTKSEEVCIMGKDQKVQEVREATYIEPDADLKLSYPGLEQELNPERGKKSKNGQN